jgi:hypothetical protein
MGKYRTVQCSWAVSVEYVTGGRLLLLGNASRTVKGCSHDDDNMIFKIYYFLSPISVIQTISFIS